MGEPPHVPVGLDDLRPQDVVFLILAYSHRLKAAVEFKGLRAKLQDFRGGEKMEKREYGVRKRRQNKRRIDGEGSLSAKKRKDRHNTYKER